LTNTNHSPANRIATAFLFAFVFALFTQAQTIRPVLSEYTAKVAKGSVELVNPGVVPLTVIMEPKSFTVSETGDISYRPLDKGIQVKLSAMSFQIPPQQSYFLFYEARADSLPAWFVLYANIGGFRKSDSGMNIRLDLPHTVYILPKQSVGKSEIEIKYLGLSPDNAHLRFSVTNSGPWFGRALESDLRSKGATIQGSGFPIYPHGTRIVEMSCKGNEAGSVFGLRLKNFRLDEPPPDPAESRVCAP
jgi:hypothetical protein